jgi:signal transduction histidine kinase
MRWGQALLGSFLFVATAARSAAPVQTLTLVNAETPVVDGLSYWVDPSATSTIDEMLAAPERFQPLSSKQPAFGYSRGALWLRLEVRNDTAETEWALGLSDMTLSFVDVWSINAMGGIQHLRSGDEVASHERPLRVRGAVFPISFPTAASKVFYLRLESRNNFSASLFLEPREAFLTDRAWNLAGISFAYGLIFALALLSLGTFAFTRDWHSLGLFGLTLVYAVAISTSDGISSWVLAGTRIGGAAKYLNYMMTLVFIGALILLYSFHHLDTAMPRASRLVLALIAAITLLSPLTISDWFVEAGLAFDILAVIISVLILTISLFSLREGFTPASWFSLAWVVFIAAGALSLAHGYGLLPRTLLTTYPLHLLAPLQTAILSIAISSRFRLAAHERDQARAASRRFEDRAADLRNLLHVLSHDLSTPMTVILGLTQTRLKTLQDQGEKQFLSRILEAANTGRDIMRTVRELESITLGSNHTPPEKVKLASVVDTACASARERLEAKHIQLVRHDDDDLSIQADPTLVTHTIIGNLLSNAIKFTPEGGTITVRIWSCEQAACLSVQDTGRGMSAEMIHSLFTLGHRQTRLGTAGEKGTGFGLLLVKAYVEKLGGRIQVSSTEMSDTSQNHGTTFTVRFPL